MCTNNLYEILSDYSSVSIIGLAKNTGKTTVLNSLIRGYNRLRQPLALSSIGRDGESADVVTKTEKPRIRICKGTVFATARQMLPYCDVTKEFLFSTGISSALGDIYVVRALSGGYVQLSGPSITSQLSGLMGIFRGLGDYKIIIDGALSRKSLSSPALCDCSILCAGPAFHSSMARVVDETAFTASLFALKKPEKWLLELIPAGCRLVFVGGDCSIRSFGSGAELNPEVILDKITPETKFIYIGGAVTDGVMLPLISYIRRNGAGIIADDATKLLFSIKTWDKLTAANAHLYVKNEIKLAAVCLNSFSPEGFAFNPALFMEKMRGKIDVPVFDLIYGSEGTDEA